MHSGIEKIASRRHAQRRAASTEVARQLHRANSRSYTLVQRASPAVAKSQHPYGQLCYSCGHEIRRGETFNRDRSGAAFFPRSLGNSTSPS